MDSKKYQPLLAQQVRDNYAKQKRVLNRNAELPLQPVTVIGAIDGDADGLLPVSALANDLAITVGDWRQGQPPAGFTEELHLEWRPDTVSEFISISIEALTTPIAETFPLQRAIEQSQFAQLEGLLHFRHGVKPWNDNEVQYATPQPITLDRIPPYGNEEPLAMEDPGQVNDASLDVNGGVIVTVPDFVESKKDFVRVAIIWSDKVPPVDQAIIPDIVELLPANRQMLIRRDLVERYASGDHYVAYELFDKAGNRSRVSRVRTVPVARGLLPINLKSPVVPLAADGFVDLEDANRGVTVEIPAFEQYHPDDQVVVTWGATPLTAKRIGEGDNPFPVTVDVSWEHLNAEYTMPAVTPYDVSVPVTYTVMRGTTPFALPDLLAIEVTVNLAHPGPVNPTDPNPVNPDLLPILVKGESDEDNHLIAADKDKDAKAIVTLYSPTRSGEVITMYWKGVAIAQTATLNGNESAGDEIELNITWNEIEVGGPGTVPVYYTVTHPDFINIQRSAETPVLVDAVPIILIAATFPDISAVGSASMLNCASLRKRQSDGFIGYRVSIPPSGFLVAKQEITLKWVLKEADQIADILGTELIDKIEIAEGADLAGIEWFVQPYDQYILPAQEDSANGWAYARVVYTLNINNGDVESQYVDTIVGIQDLEEASGTCNITSLPEIP